MNNNKSFKETDIKNRTCYYFDDTTSINYLNLHNILTD